MKYYEKNSAEIIFIVNDKGDLQQRPIALKGMEQHELKILSILRNKDVWGIKELRKLEGW